MQLQPITTKFNLNQQVIYRDSPGRIAAIRATSIVGKIGQRDEIYYDIDVGKGVDEIVDMVAEFELREAGE